ncbi:histidinol dehydrogenase [Litorimonas taeanensis]|uniref:Histidinol dehydrogenase n=1 Tax=Litorimonas taeanensis TaxID=568099 RepID=A0A420WK51_9PROT|nr:histidinol dehydrogenase [Litorimonas taeanensis]RKQ71384.1 histidinol dehydrogenase [Litorimonas taeanensis]
MRRFNWADLSDTEQSEILSRPAALSDKSLTESVRQIMDSVRIDGDKAVLDFTYQFDGVKLETLRVPKSKLENAWQALPSEDKQAIEMARSNIKKFHQAQLPKDISIETIKGVHCARQVRAIETAGLYVPGGTAPLVSTVLMLAVPAKVAGVQNRIVVTPPGKDGQINPAILAAAYRCKVSAVYACGGAQAIAALTYGTESIPKCDKIFGPGNAWVATAKSLAAQEAGGPAIDLPAGPSEAMVLADEKANPDFVASDLLSQAEHDALAQVMCVVNSAEFASQIEASVNEQLASLPRKEIATKSLALSRMIIANSRAEIVDIVNRYAPEHLIVQMDKPETLVPAIRNAGSIFLGPWTPESVGDYASGTNHTLPTYGAARAYSGVTLESFLKYISIQKLTKKGLKNLGPTVERLASLEELDAHKRAVSIRLEALK